MTGATAAAGYLFVSDFAYILAPLVVGWLIEVGGFSTAAAALAVVFGTALVAVVGAFGLASPRRTGDS